MQPTSTGNQDTKENIKIIQQPQQYIKTFFVCVEKGSHKVFTKEKSQADVNNNILLILKSENVLISTFKYKKKVIFIHVFPFISLTDCIHTHHNMEMTPKQTQP